MPKSLDVAIEIELDDNGAIRKVKGLDKALTGLKPASEKASSGMSKLKKAIGGLGLLIAARQVQRFASEAVHAFADYEREAINVQNITGMTSVEMKTLADEILNLPPALGQSTDLMKGLYQALSAGVPEDNAVAFLVENAKAAKGNLADLTTTVSASSSVLAAYGLDVSETTSVLDAMTKTVDLGKLTFEDLSANIGKGISIAAQAGVSYQELMATLATLTMSGLSVEESMTGIRNILVATIKPQSEQAKKMKELNVEMSLGALKAEGLGGFMATLAKATDENAEHTAGLFPNMRALNAAMSLTSDVGGKRLTETIDAINDSSGKVDENFKRMASSTDQRIEQVMVSWGRVKILLGEQLAPTFVKIAMFLVKIPLMFKIGVDGFTIGLLKMGRSMATFLKKVEPLVILYATMRDDNTMLEAFVTLQDLAAGAADEITALEEGILKNVDALAALEAGADAVAGAFGGGGTAGGGGGGGGVGGAVKMTSEEIDKMMKNAEAAGLRMSARVLASFNTLKDELRSGAKIAAMTTDDLFKGMEDGVKESTNAMVSTFSDMLGKGFTGEFESFADLWDEIWKDLAKTMTANLMDGFADLFGEGGAGFGGLIDLFDNSGKELGEKLGIGLGGIGGVMAAREQGGGMGALQGALSGAMAGSVFGPWGAAVGAIIGGITAYFGGESKPRLAFDYGASGFDITSAPGQKMSDRDKTLWEQQLNSIVGKTQSAYRNLTKMFGDSGLFDLVGALGDYTFGEMEGTAQDVAKWIADVWLPAQMETVFGQAISQGLSNLGLSEGAIANLWDELGLMPSADRLESLQNVIQALTMFRDIFEDFGSGDALLDLIGQSPMQIFADDMQDVRDAIDLVTVGWEDMSLTERAAEAQQIGVLFESALQTTLNMLQQIDSVRQNINQSFNRLDEDIRLGRMTDAGKQRYFRGKIVSLTGELGQAESAEEIARISAEIQRYMQSLIGVVDLESLGGDITGGTTWGNYIQDLIAQAQAAANIQLGELEDEVLAEYDALVEAMRLAEEAFLSLTESIPDQPGDGVGGGSVPEDDPEHKSVNITIIPDETALINFIWSVTGGDPEGAPGAIE